MWRFILFAVIVMALAGIGWYLARGWLRGPMPDPGALPPPDPEATARQTRRTRLRRLQRAAYALPVAAFAVLARGDTALATALGGVLMLIAGGLAAADMAQRHQAEDRPDLLPALGGATLVGGGVGAAQLVAGVPDLLAGLLGLGGAAAMLVFFGPRRWQSHKAPPSDRLAEGRSRIAGLRSAAGRIDEPRLRLRALTVAGRAAEVLALAERHGMDKARARKFLGVWLVGALDATEAFIRADGHTDPERARRYCALLTDLDTALSRIETALREADRTRLDVEIEVLSERLAAEGLA